jgi:histone-lysine N-methyltransferase SETDB1
LDRELVHNNLYLRDDLRVQVATYFVCAFFSLETDRVRRVCSKCYGEAERVCSKCYGEAENHQSVLVNMLVDHTNVYTGPKKPKNQVEIVDLDTFRFLISH